MHIHQALEAAVFAAGEHPVDRTLLINLQMIGIETVVQIPVQRLLCGFVVVPSDRLRDEVDILFIGILTVNLLD